MGSDTLSQGSDDGNRVHKRARVLLSAKVQTAQGEVAVRLRDLSRKGALVEGDQALAQGSEVVFSRGETVVPARVAWSHGHRTGLEFVHMIDESELLVHIAPARHRPTETHRRPRLIGDDLSEQERALIRMWSKQTGIRTGGIGR